MEAGEWFDDKDTTTSMLEQFDLMVDAAESILDLRGPIKALIKVYGGDFYSCFTMGQDEQLKPRNLYGDYDHKWPSHYYARSFFYKDAALLKALAFSNNRRPVVWSKVDWKPSQVRVLREAKAFFDLNEGVVFPFINQNGSISIFTVAGKEFVASRRNIAVLRDAMECAHIKALQLLDDAEALPVPVLPPKTFAVYQQFMNNLSAQSISELELMTTDGERFRLSLDGVKYHIKQIYKILDCPNKSVAEMRALQFALTDLDYTTG